MKTTKLFSNKEFKYGEFAAGVKSLLSDMNHLAKAPHFSCTKNLHGIEDNIDLDEASLQSLTGFGKELRSASIYFESGLAKNFLHFIFDITDGLLVAIEAADLKDLNRLTDGLNSWFGLKEPSAVKVRAENIWEKIGKVEERIDTLERNQKQIESKLSCFISMRFNDRSKQYLLKLKDFLELVGIEVVTGLDYQPRKVSDKVVAKLDQKIDFIIYLVTIDGESLWTRDELVMGSHRNYFPFPLVEKGAKFSSGVFADLEYIEFDEGVIEQTFIKILQGLRFIGELKNERK